MYILGVETASTSGGSQTAGRPCQRICTSKYLVSFDSFLYNISVSRCCSGNLGNNGRSLITKTKPSYRNQLQVQRQTYDLLMMMKILQGECVTRPCHRHS